MSETVNTETFPAGVFDLRDLVYTSTDGKFQMPFEELHRNTIVNGLTRVFDHVTGNESISPASTAKSKDPTLSDEAYAEIVLKAREKHFGNMKAGLWGEKGNRAPRQVGVDELDTIRRMICAEDTRKAIAKKQWAKGEKRDTWIVNGREYSLEQAMQAFLNNKEDGEARKLSIENRAQARWAQKKVEAAEKRAAAERAAKASQPDDGDEMAL